MSAYQSVRNQQYFIICFSIAIVERPKGVGICLYKLALYGNIEEFRGESHHGLREFEVVASALVSLIHRFRDKISLSLCVLQGKLG